MGLFFNFNTSKPKSFQYRPLYYDERKERLNKMKAQAEAALSAEKKAPGYTGLDKGFLSEKRAVSKLRYAKLERQSAFRFVIILIILLGALYVIMPEIFMAFWTRK